MVFFNYSTMQMAAKIVYYGPGLCGKTTNLQYIFDHTANNARGEMVSLETETDRTLFFDMLPIEVGSIVGFTTRIQLYTVPGQVFYNTTRKLVLKGVDGVVFVADSQRPMLQANVDSLRNLEENLSEMGLSLDSIPMVLQYNKRDLDDICSVKELDEALNRNGWLIYEASAIDGRGVFETLKAISKATLLHLKQRLTREGPPQLRKAAAGQQRRFGAPAPPPPAVAPVAKAAPSPPAQGRPATTRRRGGKSKDVFDELEKIRREALRPAPQAVASNGSGEISRSVELTLDRQDFERARRFLVQLSVQDDDRQVVESLHDLEVDLGDLASLERLLLRLDIALNPKKD